jgi:DNA-binding NarL/FixJ family response regulator
MALPSIENAIAALQENPQIIVADDEPPVLNLVTALIVQARPDFEVLPAANGREAIAYLVDPKYHPAIVLTDRMMPHVDGMQLLVESKALYPTTPVIMLTGAGTIQDVNEAYGLGLFQYLEKPVSVNTLVPVLDSALDLYRKATELALSNQMALRNWGHFLNNPRAIVEGFGELLSDEKAVGEMSADRIAGFGRSIVESMSTISAIQEEIRAALDDSPLDVTAVDLGDMVAESYGALADVLKVPEEGQVSNVQVYGDGLVLPILVRALLRDFQTIALGDFSYSIGQIEGEGFLKVSNDLGRERPDSIMNYAFGFYHAFKILQRMRGRVEYSKTPNSEQLTMYLPLAPSN